MSINSFRCSFWNEEMRADCLALTCWKAVVITKLRLCSEMVLLPTAVSFSLPILLHSLKSEFHWTQPKRQRHESFICCCQRLCYHCAALCELLFIGKSCCSIDVCACEHTHLGWRNVLSCSNCFLIWVYQKWYSPAVLRTELLGSAGFQGTPTALEMEVTSAWRCWLSN